MITCAHCQREFEFSTNVLACPYCNGTAPIEGAGEECTGGDAFVAAIVDSIEKCINTGLPYVINATLSMHSGVTKQIRIQITDETLKN